MPVQKPRHLWGNCFDVEYEKWYADNLGMCLSFWKSLTILLCKNTNTRELCQELNCKITTFNMNPSDRLKKIRKKLNLTQELFGKSIGLNRDKIMSLESEKVKLSELHAIAIEYIYNINRDWLLNGIDPMCKNTNGDLISTQKQNINSPDESNDKKHNFKTTNKGKDAINALLEIEKIDEQTFRRTVADLEFIADKLKEGATPGPLIAATENKILGELTKEKDNI
nr:helix-turn-helix transcriptional regulator [uncultured Desulfobacter sp.]